MKSALKVLSLIIGITLIISSIYYFICLPFNTGIIMCIIFGALFIFFGLCKWSSPVFNILRGLFIFVFIFSFVFIGIKGSINTSNGKEKYIIVLGCGLNGEKITRNLEYRLEQAVKLYEENPNSIIIVSGGKGEHEIITESEAMLNYLISNGVNDNKVITETESTSTYENLTYSEKLIQERNDCHSVCIISNDYHIFRIRMILSRLGLTANYVGAKTDWKTVPVCFLRELAAILKDAVYVKKVIQAF